ncbi:histidine kinase [Lachnospiraceae bacterium 62-35]
MAKLPISKKILLLTSLQCLIILTFFLYSAINMVQDKCQKYLLQNHTISAHLLQDFTMRTKTIADLSAFPVTQIPGAYKNVIYSSLSHDTFLSNFTETQLISDNIISHLNNNKYLQGIHIYNLKGNGIYCESDNLNYFFTKAQPDSFWFQTSLKNLGRACLFPVDSIQETVKGDHSPSCYYISRAIINVERYRPVGIIVLSIHISDLDEYFSSVRPFSSQQYAILENEQPIAGNLSITPFVLNRLKDSEKSFLIIREDSGFQLYQHSEGEACQVIIKTPLRSIMASFSGIPIVFFLILCGLLMLIVLFFYHVLQSINRPITQLADACNELELDCFPVVPDQGLSPELHMLSASFNKMSQRIDYLINKILRKDIYERDLELQLLRTQINPHYLYNTLECMRMRAYINKDYKVSEMAELLAHNLQYGLRNTGIEVTLKEETQRLEEYITLMSYHYEHHVNISLCIPEYLLPYKTIKLLFQPLVENAIVHGMKTKTCIDIDILGYIEENRLYFTISDNGSGISPDELELLKKDLNDFSLSSSSIGLKNISRRLSLYYGKPYGLDIASIYGSGTIITVCIPANL